MMANGSGETYIVSFRIRLMLESEPFLDRLPLPFGVEVWS